MVFIHVYHSKAWLVDDYRDPALETNITTTVTGAATRDPLFESDPKMMTSSALLLFASKRPLFGRIEVKYYCVYQNGIRGKRLTRNSTSVLSPVYIMRPS